MYVLCFGNPYIKEDSLISKHIKSFDKEGYTFILCKSPDDILSYAEKNFIILDVAKGIEEPCIITDATQLRSRNLVSSHDFDLNFFLRLFEKLGQKIKILAIPFNYTKEQLFKTLEEFI